MLGKLLKYEFRSTSRLVLPLFGALLIVALVNRLFMSLSLPTPTAISITIAVIMIIAVFVIVLLITLFRFYKNLLTNEGYLMFTLPVSTDSLIWSKLIVAFVWNLLSLIVVFFAIVIMSITDLNIRDVWTEVLAVSNNVGITSLQVTGYIIQLIVLGVVGLLTAILTLYVCMSLSLLVNKSRVLVSFAAFIVLSIIGQIVSSVGMLLILPHPPNYYGNPSIPDIISLVNTSIVFSIIFTFVSGVILYFITSYMLKKRLNLE